jgi:mRNA-degrading endonuclease RelE of RelBE toxin-antitoxin system
MKIIETTIFTRRLKSILTDDEYRELQYELINNPKLGKIILGTGGLRKIRWRGSGRGKSGGSRVIYYWYSSEETILMLLIYKKKEQDDLSPEQHRILKKIINQEFK